MYTFRLHRRGLVLAVLAALLAAVLLIVGGCLVGEWRAGRAAASAAPAAGVGAEGAEGPGTAGAPSPVPALDPAAEPVQFALRLGTFTDPEEAQGLADQASGRGYPATIVPAETGDGVPLFLVTIGSYGSRWEARGAARELAEREERRGWRPVVVPVPEAP